MRSSSSSVARVHGQSGCAATTKVGDPGVRTRRLALGQSAEGEPALPGVSSCRTTIPIPPTTRTSQSSTNETAPAARSRRAQRRRSLGDSGCPGCSGCNACSDDPRASGIHLEGAVDDLGLQSELRSEETQPPGPDAIQKRNPRPPAIHRSPRNTSGRRQALLVTVSRPSRLRRAARTIPAAACGSSASATPRVSRRQLQRRDLAPQSGHLGQKLLQCRLVLVRCRRLQALLQTLHRG